MAARLVIGAHAYALHEEHDGVWMETAVLAGGAAALLPAAGVDEMQLEAAIERAEDWLMPHASRLRGAVLEVQDETGRVWSGMNAVLGVEARAWSVADVEVFFSRVVHLATGRVPSPALQDRATFAADVVLLRELAHHAQLKEIRFSGLLNPAGTIATPNPAFTHPTWSVYVSSGRLEFCFGSRNRTYSLLTELLS